MEKNMEESKIGTEVEAYKQMQSCPYVSWGNGGIASTNQLTNRPTN
jgi:hypothetical protein